MKDSILWSEESDNYTHRAKANFKDVYQEYDLFAVNKCSSILNSLQLKPSKVLDLGCAYGGFIYHLSKIFTGSQFFGIDPGEESIKLAQENVGAHNVKFQQGHAHTLPYADNTFDLIILNMVLQWVPRNYLIRTLAEIDRVLATNGIVFVQEFLPNTSKYSASSHDQNIFIFKDDYSKFFTAFPWLRMLYQENIDSNKGDDYQKVIFLIEKTDLNKAYSLKTWK